MKRMWTALLALVCVARASAAVIPPDVLVDGKTQTEWSVEWCQWVYRISTNKHPLLDYAGMWANGSQPEGSVFFVAGTYGDSGSVQRQFVVPQGKHLFFPVVAALSNCIDAVECSAETVREAAAGYLDLFSDLHASVDGAPIVLSPEHRLASEAFSIALTSTDNLFSLSFGRDVSGLVESNILVGQWVMIDADSLSLGPHELRFGATRSGPEPVGFEVTCTITVLPELESLGVVPPNAVIAGNTIGEWSAEWWKWVFAASTNQNPHLDRDGRWADVNQPGGNVFFLGGHPGLEEWAGTLSRTFVVPEGKYLFFPLVTAIIDNLDTDPPLTVEVSSDFLQGYVDLAIELHASIDGVEIPGLKTHRAISPVFSLEFASSDNFKSVNIRRPTSGWHDLNISDGYWLMIEPLPAGVHVLNYGGLLPGLFSRNDVIAHIYVVPAP